MRGLMRRCVDELRYIVCFFACFMGYVLHGAGWGTVILDEIGYRITEEGLFGRSMRTGRMW